MGNYPTLVELENKYSVGIDFLFACLHEWNGRLSERLQKHVHSVVPQL